MNGSAGVTSCFSYEIETLMFLSCKDIYIPPDEPFHHFGASKFDVKRSWSTKNSSIHGFGGSKTVKGLIGHSTWFPYLIFLEYESLKIVAYENSEQNIYYNVALQHNRAVSLINPEYCQINCC